MTIVNIVDPENIVAASKRIFKRSLKNPEINDWVEKSVVRWLKRRHDNAALIPPGSSFDNNLPEWGIKARQEGRELHRFVLGVASEDILKHISDFLADLNKLADSEGPAAQKAQKLIGGLNRTSVEQAYDLADEFYEKLAQDNVKSASRSRNEIFAVERADGKPVSLTTESGRIWKQIVPRGLKTVAVQLKNCLGGSSYAHGVKNGTMEIWALVDPTTGKNPNDPSSIVVAAHINIQHKTLVEAKEEGNRIPVQYKSDIDELCTKTSVSNNTVQSRQLNLANNNAITAEEIRDKGTLISQEGEWEIISVPLETRIAGLKEEHKYVAVKRRDDQILESVNIGEYGVAETKEGSYKSAFLVSRDYPYNNKLIDRDFTAAMASALALLRETDPNLQSITLPYAYIVSHFDWNAAINNPTLTNTNKKLGLLIDNVSKNTTAWQDRVVYSDGDDSTQIHVLSDGSLVLHNDQRLKYVPPTTYLSRLSAECIKRHPDEIPVSSLRWRQLSSQIPYENEALAAGDEQTKLMFNDSILNNNNFIVFDSDFWAALMRIDPSGLVASGSYKSNYTFHITNEKTSLSYVSSVFGKKPDDFDSIPTGLGWQESLQDLELTEQIAPEISIHKMKSKVITPRQATGSDIFIKSNGIMHPVAKVHGDFTSIYPVHLPDLEKDSPQNRNFLQDISVLKSLNEHTKNIDRSELDSVYAYNTYMDTYPLCLVRDGEFLPGRLKNLLDDETPVIKLEKPKRYVGIIPDENGNLETGKIAWVSMAPTSGKLRLLHILPDGQSHLSRTLLKRGWRLEPNVNHDAYFAKTGYGIVEGVLVESSNNEINNSIIHNHKVTRNLNPNVSNCDIPTGEDRHWIISGEVYDPYRKQNKDVPIFSITATGEKIGNKNTAYITSSHPLENADSIKCLCHVLNASNLTLDWQTCVWLGVEKDPDTNEIIPSERQAKIQLASGHYIENKSIENSRYEGRPYFRLMHSEDKCLATIDHSTISTLSGNVLTPDLLLDVQEFFKIGDQLSLRNKNEVEYMPKLN